MRTGTRAVEKEERGRRVDGRSERKREREWRRNREETERYGTGIKRIGDGKRGIMRCEEGGKGGTRCCRSTTRTYLARAFTSPFRVDASRGFFCLRVSIKETYEDSCAMECPRNNGRRMATKNGVKYLEIG